MLCLFAFLFVAHKAVADGPALPGTARVRHAPEISGTVQGSIQQLAGENVSLPGGGTISDDLLVPGTPTVVINGKPSFGGTTAGSGAATPSGYSVTLNGRARLAHLLTRTDPVALQTVAIPAAPVGLRDLAITTAGTDAGPWDTVRNLALSGNAGQYVVPPGVYGEFSATASSGFTLGIAGATQPSIYEFQRFTLGGHARLEVIGPVVLKIRYEIIHSGQAGTTEHPEWLEVRIASGGITLNGGSALNGYVYAPNGTATINGNSELNGGLECDRLIVVGKGLLRLWQRDTSGQNVPPEAQDQAVLVSEDVPTPITLTAVDPDSGTLAYTVTSQPAHGTLSGSAPNLVYTTNLNSNAPDSFTFVVSDGLATSGSATVSITVTPVNDAPEATGQSIVVTEDVPYPLTLGGTDAEGTELTIVEVSDPPHGSVAEVNGVWVYTPDTNYNGDDAFSFKVFDGERTSVAADVNIIVTPQNDEPTATPRSVVVEEDDEVSISFAGLDIDGDPLTFAIETPPLHGSLSDILDGKIYRPALNFDQSDSFTYTASDDESTSLPALVSITVIPRNDPPIAHGGEVETNEDVPIEIPLQGEDIDSANLTYLPDTEPSRGTLTRNGNVWTYTPDPNKSGLDTFTFKVNDGEFDSPAAEVRVVVHPVNDRPEAHTQTIDALEDTPKTIVLTGDDVDEDALAYEILTQPAHGVLAGSDREWIYTPAANFRGCDSFTFRVFDGELWSDPATVAINVEAVNDTPTVNAGDDVNAQMGSVVSLAGSGSDDGDPEDSTLGFTWTKVSGPGAVGFVDASAAATQAAFSASGTYVLRLTASDSDLSAFDEVTIVVAPGNQAPLVNAGPDQALAQPGAVVLEGSVNDDGNPAGTSLRQGWEKLSGPGEVSFSTPQSLTTAAAFTVPGTYVLRLSVSDTKLAGSDEVIVRVAQPNAAPVVNAGADAQTTLGDAFTVAGQMQDDGQPAGIGTSVFWTKVSGPGDVMFASPGETSSRVSFGAIGTYVLRLEASDSELTATDEVTVTVAAVPNQAPVVDAGLDQTLNGGTAAVLSGKVTDDGRPAGSSVTVQWSKVSGPGVATFSNATALETTVRFGTPGSYVLSLTGSDGELSAADQVTVVVATTNRAPVAHAGPDQQSLSSTGVNLSGTAEDDGLPANGTLNFHWSKVSGPGTVTFVDPDAARTQAGFSVGGTYVLRLAVSDSELSGTDELVIDVTETSGNLPPVVEAGPDQVIHLPGRVASRPPGEPVTVPLVPITTLIKGSIGIDYHAPTNKVVVSVNYDAHGLPNNFDLIDENGGHTPFSSISGLTDELKLATVRIEEAGTAPTRFKVGEMFTGTGIPGHIIRVAPDGTVVGNPWVVLPGETGLLRGSLHVDRTGVFGGDLIVVTTTGGVWRVSSDGTPHFLVRILNEFAVAVHLEGVMTVPNDPIRYGPWAGRILVGAEDQTRFYTVDTMGTVTWFELGIRPEDIDLVEPDQNFYIVQHKVDRVLGAPASAFESMVGDIVVCEEGSRKLWNLRWTGSGFRKTVIAQIVESGDVEHMTFAPTGIVNFPTTANPTIELEGSVADDGNPAGQPLTSLWSTTAGPGPVSFGNPGSPVTTATLSVPGEYVLTLTGNDTQLSTSDLMRVSVLQPNAPPQVSAGEDQEIGGASPATTLIGFVSDDGVSTGVPLEITWSAVYAPGTVTFANSNQAQTTASFSAPGLYILKLTAYDGQLEANDLVEIHVNQPRGAELPSGVVAWWRANGDTTDSWGDHDATNLTTSFGAGTNGAGFVFSGIGEGLVVTPPGSLDIAANGEFTIEFWAKPDVVELAPLLEWNNGARYAAHVWMGGGGSVFVNLVDRNNVAHMVSSPAGAFVAGQWQHIAVTYRTSTGRCCIYRNGDLIWDLLVGSFTPEMRDTLYFGSRVSGGQDGFRRFKGVLDEITLYDRALDTELRGIYLAGELGKAVPGSNHQPAVYAGPDLDLGEVTDSAALAGVVSDDGLPLGQVTLQWTAVTGPGTVTFADAASASTTASFSAPGVYLLKLAASDGLSEASDIVEVRVNACETAMPSGAVAWWRANGSSADSVGGHDATILDATYVPGVVGQAWYLNANARRAIVVDPPGAVDIGAGDGFTIEFWARPDTVGEAPLIEWNTGANYAAHMWMWSGGSLLVNLVDTNNGAHQHTTASNFFAAGQWVHVALTYDRLTGQCRVYRNGAQFGNSVSLGIFRANTTTRLYFGRRIAGTSASFRYAGAFDEITFYERALTSTEIAQIHAANSNGKCPGGDLNQPPIVSAGSDLVVRGSSITLAGAVNDDGLPNEQLTSQWSVVSGPGAVNFAATTNPVTLASFALPGRYVLRLTASDGTLSRSDDIVVTVEAGPNVAPSVSAGPDRVISIDSGATLAGQVFDDGQPLGGTVTASWTKVDGPGSVQFSSPSNPATTVTFSAVGDYTLRLTGSDGALSRSDDVRIRVISANNAPPIVDLGPDQTIDFGQVATLQPVIDDDGRPDGGVYITWHQSAGPGVLNLTFGTNGAVTVHFPAAGIYRLRLTADDGALSTTDEVTFTVQPVATAAPVVALTAPTNGANIQRGETIRLRATASDPDLEGGIVSVAFYADGVLLGTATQFDETGAAEWPWNAAVLGSHTFAAVATDLSGTTATSANVTVTVTPPVPAVRLTSPTTESGFRPGTAIAMAASASANVGINRVEFFAGSTLVSTDSSAPYTATWNPGAPGEYSLTAVAYDTAGTSATSSPVHVFILDAPTGPPIVEISSPVDGGSITAPVPIIGTISSPALRDWTLDRRRLNDECGDWVVIATGTGAGSGATLGTLDPTLLINGHYELRLVVRDRFGGVWASTSTVAVEGDMKVGHFTVAFQDLQVPLAGVPLTVTRTYDSREQCPGDFGYGWRLDVEGLRLEQSAPIGDGWGIVVTEGTLSSPSTYQLVDNVSHLLSVRMPDGEMLRFQPKLVVDRAFNRLASMLDSDGDDVGQAWLPIQYDQGLKIVYRALGGTKGATLKALRYRARDPWSGGEGTSIGSSEHVFVSEPYDGPINLAIDNNSGQNVSLVTGATGWELTLKDGRVFLFDANGRMESMHDAVGNTLTFVRNGAGQILRAVHSSGKEVVFNRDGDGFIQSITDPRGNEVNYGYDSAGHLRTFYDRETDPGTEAPTQSYTYKPGTHLVEDLFDAKGVRAVRNFFDAQGRLQRTIDAKGKETIFTHDIAGRTETIIDRAGNTTVHHYDERGNVTETHAPDGTVTRTQYHTWKDGRKSDLKTSESVTGLFTNDAGGLEQKTITTTLSYEDDDAATPLANDGLLRKIVDPLGHTTRMSYDDRGNLLAITDPLTHTTTNTYYPGTDLLQTTTDAMGNVTTMTYDARGQLDTETRTVTVIDAAGTAQVQTLVTDTDYDPNGYLVKMTDARAHETTYENDIQGNRLFERTTRTNSLGQLVAVVTEHEYDANDRLIKIWDAQHPRSGGHQPTSETVYDENGKPSIMYDALRRATQMLYNERGELERTDFSDGTSETTLYDADGRREFLTNRHGKTTQTVYDALGRVINTIFLGSGSDAAVTLSGTSYDAAGRVYQSTDANGHTTTGVYDAAGRRTQTIDALLHTSISQYDAAGNLRFFTDAKGNTTEHVYDLLNRRTATILPAAPLDVNGDGTIDGTEQNVVTGMSTGYDELGRRISETDANGRTRRFIYDKLGRLRQVVEPAPVAGDPVKVTEYTYDELGNQLTQVDANQHTTHYSYDSIGRRLTRTLPLGQVETAQYDAAGNLRYRTDFNGKTTEFQYDALNRLRFRIPDATLSEPTVEWRYTATGQRERMIDGHGTTIYGYDSRDRLETKASPEGTLTYGHDDAGNVTSMTSSNANGVAIIYRYDELNRLHEVEENGSEITSYQYDDVGNLERFTTANGVAHVYGYNALNRLSGLTVSNATQVLATYGYTQLRSGHRSGAAEELAGTPANPQSVTRNLRFGYDALYRLRSETIAANAGPGGTVTYGLDPIGNRLSRTSTVAGLSNQAFSYDDNDRLESDTFDPNGNTKAGKITLNNQGAETTAQTANDSYDSENRLISRTIASQPSAINIVYDGDGNKVSETVNGQTISYLIDALNPTGYAQVVEELQNGTVVRTYTYGHDLLLQDQNNAGTWTATWFGYDGHGSVRFLTDALGQITDRYDYDAFGILLSSSGTTFNRYRYCGEQFEEALGLYYLRARHMNAANGRFWSMDEWESDEDEPEFLNTYTYANDDPISNSDPTGFAALNQILGYQAELNVQVAYLANSGVPLDKAVFGGLAHVALNIPLERVKPDLLGLPPHLEYGEVKPLTFSGIRSGLSQMRKYARVLGKIGFKPTQWNGKPNVGAIFSPAPEPIVWENVGGIVFWTNDIFKYPVLKVAAAAASGYVPPPGAKRGTVVSPVATSILYSIADRTIKPQATAKRFRFYAQTIQKAREAQLKTHEKVAALFATMRGL